MEKITEKVLLDRGSPKTNTLEQIRTLNLSRLGLHTRDLPVTLLCRLHELEQLDLSGNRLKELPAGLCLPSLRVLDCSDNDLESMASLLPLRGLEELRLEDNLYLTISDNYKLMFLLPKLRVFNGKDVSLTVKHLRQVESESLKKRVIGLWDKTFLLPHNPSTEKLMALESEFVKAACDKIKHGPSSLSDYTKWRVEMIAKDHMRSLTNAGRGEIDEDVDTLQVRSLLSTPKRRISQGEGSGQKRRRAVEDASAQDSPRKSHHPQTTPTRLNEPLIILRKVGRQMSSPSGKQPIRDGPTESLQETCSKLTPRKEKHKDGVSRKQACQKSQEVLSLQPVHVLQCHSKQDSPEDFSTQLWACAFELPLHNSYTNQELRTAATCGGDSVCLIDCETGHVLKKYKVPGEEFFSLSWTHIMMSRDGGVAQPCSILAAGGKKGVVKLLHPRANIAYGEFRASRRALSTLRFSPHQPSVLFTGGYENKIVMWDVGGVDSSYNFKVSQLLVLETASAPLHLCLPPTCRDTHLLAASEEGLLCFSIRVNKDTQKRSREMEVTFPIYEKEDKDTDYHIVDGLGFLTDDIVASKCYMAGSIYLWSWSQTRARQPNRRKEVPAVVLAVLQWSSTETPYLSLSTCPDKGYVVCGDENGNLWIYHVTDILKAGAMSGKAIPPTEMQQWPSPMRKGHGPVQGPVINSVAMDPELRYLVALSDKNIVVVWKRLEAC